MRDKITHSELEELEALQELTRMPGWRIVRNILHRHKVDCIEKSNAALRKHEDRKAGEWLAKSTIKDKVMGLVEQHKKQLSNKREKEI